MNNNLITLNKLSKYYQSGNNKIEILKNINLKFKQGKIISVVGESGTGKSTFLNVISGLDYVSSGNVIIKDTDITNLNEKKLAVFRNKYIGFVFQQHNLLAEFSAIENIILPGMLAGKSRKELLLKAESILDEFGLNDKKQSRTGELSGGELQRISIARAVINNPILILADEPTGNLDDKNTKIVKNILFNLKKKFNTTVIMVTHSKLLAKGSDKILVLKNQKLRIKK